MHQSLGLDIVARRTDLDMALALQAYSSASVNTVAGLGEASFELGKPTVHRCATMAHSFARFEIEFENEEEGGMVVHHGHTPYSEGTTRNWQPS